MRLEWRTYTTAKSGNRPDENEDVCLPRFSEPGNIKEFRCALTDGATSTSFSRQWARILAEAAIRDIHNCHQGIRTVLKNGQALWSEHLKALDLPWHALEKTKQGAFSTLLWFKAAQTGYANKTLGVWQALAVGDSCFCQLRENKIQASFPVIRAEALNNHPVLLASVDSRNDRVYRPENMRTGQGAFEGGDEFLFMTDALTGWFLNELEGGRNPLESLRMIISDPNAGEREFDSMVRRLRSSGAIKNDDTTLGYLKIQREPSRFQERAWN
jgi:hypothetical protein